MKGLRSRREHIQPAALHIQQGAQEYDRFAEGPKMSIFWIALHTALPQVTQPAAILYLT